MDTQRIFPDWRLLPQRKGHWQAYVRLAVACTSLIAAAVFGYGKWSGAVVKAVSGSVTFHGRPVGTGVIAFIPIDPGGDPMSCRIDAGGRFTIRTRPPGFCIDPGRYRVAIMVEGRRARGDDQGRIFPATCRTPDRYADFRTSGIEATVSRAGLQRMSFDLVR